MAEETGGGGKESEGERPLTAEEWRIANFTRTIQRNRWIPDYVREGLMKNQKQRLFLLFSDILEVFYGGSAGGGKRLRLDEVVPTPGGWATVGELSVGDALFDEKGRVCRVTELFPIDVATEAYEMEFDDGSRVESCAGHLWLTLTNRELSQLTRYDPDWRARRRARRVSRATGLRSALFNAAITKRNQERAYTVQNAPEGTVRTTREIFETLRDKRGRTNHAIPVAEPLELPDVELPLDPYLLGVWLGDGTSRIGQITSMDQEIFQAFTEAGFECSNRSDKPGNRASSWSFCGLSGLLKKMGLIQNKHIPPIYLRASRAQRLALLQGLMDTDGTVTDSGAVEFTNTNPQLAEGVRELIVSLGWKARKIESRATLYGRDMGAKWDIKWAPSDYVFRLPRKRDKQILARRRTTRFRYIVNCRPCAPSPMRCIAVDSPRRLFLVGRSMIPTHNSIATLVAATQYVDCPGYSALLLRENFADLDQPKAWLSLSREWWHGKGPRWNEKKYRWTFPSGATVTFGYLDSDRAVYQYDSAAFNFIGIDELTQMSEWRYRFMFGRLRRPKEGLLSQVPLRMRSASNPGNVGHLWVRKRFIDPKTREKGALYIPATLDDNAGNIDAEEYRHNALAKLDPITRRQRELGDWDAVEGGRFQREWFGWYRKDRMDPDLMILTDYHGKEIERFRWTAQARFQTCDPAASTSERSDYFVNATWLVSPKANIIWLANHRAKYEIAEQVTTCQRLYRQYNPQFLAVEEVLNQRALAQLLRKSTNPLMVVRGVSPRGQNKLDHAAGFITLCASNRVFLPENPGPDFDRDALLTELLCFTGENRGKEKDDQCFVAGTMIRTREGERPIETIRPGDEVWTRKGLRRVRRAGMTNPAARVLTIQLSNGRSLTGTAGHPIFLEGRGFVPLEEFAEVIGAGHAPVFNLTVEGEPEYYANGVLVHNCDVGSYMADMLPFVRAGVYGTTGKAPIRYQHNSDPFAGLK